MILKLNQKKIDEEKTENMYKTIILSTSKEFTNKKEEEEKVSGE